MRSLWFGLLGGPAAWALRLVVSYAFVPVACLQGWQVWLHVLSALFFVIALIAALVARRRWQTLRETDEKTVAEQVTREQIIDEWSWKRSRFMAHLGLLMSSFFALVILAEWSATLFIDPCSVR
jgi:hypothetical protein